MGHALNVSGGDHGTATMIERINNVRISSLPFAAPKRGLETTEASLVRDALRVLQGSSTSIFPWDPSDQGFYIVNGIHIQHLSQSSLYNILQVFARAGSSLRRVDCFAQRVLNGNTASYLKPISLARPTLVALVNVVHMRLASLRRAALEKELEDAAGAAGTGVTLLSLFANLSRVFAGAEFLEHVVNVAIPELDKLYNSDMSAGQLAAHILSSLYKELNSFCLTQDDQEDAYGTLLLLFVGSLWPTVTSLDSWLREGILCDPAGELFFYEDKSVPIENSAFWESRFHFRDFVFSKDHSNLQLLDESQGSSHTTSENGPNGTSRGFSMDFGSVVSTGGVPQRLVCPSFFRSIAKEILSAGKSLQLLQHVRRKHTEGDRESPQVPGRVSSMLSTPFLPMGFISLIQFPGRKEPSDLETVSSSGSGSPESMEGSSSIGEEQLSLFEQFCASLKTLLGVGLMKGPVSIDPSYWHACSVKGRPTKEDLLDVLFFRRKSDLGGSVQCAETKINELLLNSENKKAIVSDWKTDITEQELEVPRDISNEEAVLESIGGKAGVVNGENIVKGIGMASVVDSVQHLNQNGIQKDCIKLAQYCTLSAIKDAQLQLVSNSNEKVTDYNYGLDMGKVLLLHDKQTLNVVKKLLQYPTVVLSFQQQNVSETLPSVRNSRDVVGILKWTESATLEATPALVVVQECLTYSIKKQVDHVGQQLLAKLMGEWRLMEELALLRAIYLVGSGPGMEAVVNILLVDLLPCFAAAGRYPTFMHFASVLFSKLDRGEPWDDFYELNTILQESVRSSSHGLFLPVLDSLVVAVLPCSAAKAERGPQSISSPPQIAGRAPSFAINSLDSLFITYKVAWPLELIIDSNAIKKYNQVMLFLLKVKRAKHALDKACRWTWKKGVGDVGVHKRRLLLQQKLMHFVNTLHQYVMDRVLYSAWVDLCENMSSAGSLDEVIACHDAYMVSIQRQCLVAPDKLWTLIAGRVKAILALALNYYSVERVLCDGAVAPSLSLRCQLEVERIEKQFDECMVFLMQVLSFKLNVGHFPHLADLVTRINFNFYYMTEDGQLSTPLPEQVVRHQRGH